MEEFMWFLVLVLLSDVVIQNILTAGGWMIEVLLSDVVVVNNVLNDPGPTVTVMTVTPGKMKEVTIAVIVRGEEKSMLLLA